MEARLFLDFFTVRPGNVDVFLQHSYYCWSSLAKLAAMPFFIPPPDPSGRTSDWGWGSQLTLCPELTHDSENVVQDGQKARRSSLWSPDTFWIAPSLSPCKAVWALTCLNSWERQIFVKSGVNHFSRHIGAWASFMTLSQRSFSSLSVIWVVDTVAVRFLWSAATATRSPTSPFDNRL
jgi:hypothetical protein